MCETILSLYVCTAGHCSHRQRVSPGGKSQNDQWTYNIKHDYVCFFCMSPYNIINTKHAYHRLTLLHHQLTYNPSFLMLCHISWGQVQPFCHWYWLNFPHITAQEKKQEKTHPDKKNKLFHVIPVIIPVRVAQPQPVKSPLINNVKCAWKPLVGAWLSAANECL